MILCRMVLISEVTMGTPLAYAPTITWFSVTGLHCTEINMEEEKEYGSEKMKKYRRKIFGCSLSKFGRNLSCNSRVQLSAGCHRELMLLRNFGPNS
jgi:hypothetical protein